MILVRTVMAPEAKARDEMRELMRSHWPGGLSPEGREVPESPRLRCRHVREVGRQNGLVWLEAIYEG